MGEKETNYMRHYVVN